MTSLLTIEMVQAMVRDREREILRRAPFVTATSGRRRRRSFLPRHFIRHIRPAV